jgi:hypothetical protein
MGGQLGFEPADPGAQTLVVPFQVRQLDLAELPAQPQVLDLATYLLLFGKLHGEVVDLGVQHRDLRTGLRELLASLSVRPHRTQQQQVLQG